MRNVGSWVTKGALACAVLLAPSASQAGVIRISEAAFLPSAGLIEFSEFGLGTVNPTYAPGDYGGGVGAPTVTFDGFFLGQALGTPATCPPGAAVSGCVVGSPSDPLTLDPASPNTFITGDGANPTSPVLSGTPQFNGAIGILFSNDQAGVGLDGGYFDSIGGTAITAYNRAGVSLGTVTNEGLGIEFLGLVMEDGSAQIAGLLFHLVGAEPAGFAIDNVRFGLPGQVQVPGAVPEPATMTLLGMGLVGAGVRRYRQRKQVC